MSQMLVQPGPWSWSRLGALGELVVLSRLTSLVLFFNMGYLKKKKKKTYQLCVLR